MGRNFISLSSPSMCILRSLWLDAVHFIFHQVCFMFISAYHASDIFETCPHTHRFRTVAVKVMVSAFGSFMPAFILANHVHYSEQVGPLS